VYLAILVELERMDDKGAFGGWVSLEKMGKPIYTLRALEYEIICEGNSPC
jgi:hypothetical protein